MNVAAPSVPADPADLAGNPLLVSDGLPPFDRIRPAHVVPAVRHVLQGATARLEEIERGAGPDWDRTCRPLEVLDEPFEYAWKPVGHLVGVLNSQELREAHEAVLGEVVAFGLRVSQSEPLFRALQGLADGPAWKTLTEPQRRVVEWKLRQMKLAGIGLPAEQRTKFNENAKELSKLGTDFANHVLDAVKAWSLIVTDPADAEGWPESLRRLAAQSHDQARGTPGGPSLETPAASPETGPWRITLDAPSFGPFLQHCRKRELREQVYRAFVTKASSGELDNGPLIRRILQLRREQARLLGYRDYAEVSLASKMAPGIGAVEAMFERLRSASWDAALRDLEEVRALAAASGQPDPIAVWDVAFWAERLRERKFDFTEEELRPYFSLERVLEGLFRLVHGLFGITVRPRHGVPTWHPDVRYYEVFDEVGQQIAGFYLDPYSRPENKRGGAWMDDCLGRRRRSDGRVQIPVAHLVCNSTPPVGDRPSLMTFREVETLFHEFGHGLQHMLTVVDEADAAGIGGVEWDAVELPSQFMENWCYHEPTLIGMTAHFETGAPLPRPLFEKIVQARTFRSGSMMLRQLQFGMTDMALHHDYDPDGPESVLDVQRRVAARTSVLPPLPEDRSLCAFQHVFAGGYAAGYYSYKWAEVLSADAFGAFEEAGLDDAEAVSETGRRFRDTILAQGGGRHPMDLFRDFRGREPSPDALLRQHGLL